MYLPRFSVVFGSSKFRINHTGWNRFEFILDEIDWNDKYMLYTETKRVKCLKLSASYMVATCSVGITLFKVSRKIIKEININIVCRWGILSVFHERSEINFSWLSSAQFIN